MCVISNIRCGMSAVYFHFKDTSLIMTLAGCRFEC